MFPKVEIGAFSHVMDFKSQLQEMVQQTNNGMLNYEIVDEKGPAHNRTFVSRVMLNDEELGVGRGKSKKEAEQQAAQSAMNRIKGIMNRRKNKMFLKRLEVIGFKSFADRIGIDFVPGVTAVVGPNGSGKSNVTDAIRWVLGEQSAKSLRGAKMEDVIFAGSESTKTIEFCRSYINFR